ncbi:uncharacterized protein LOC135290267 [Passer domesticus]|uniref:uncharacterized protein LOC135290267 n=1 Tax=Passer domesticus TaxID=48849 RepID=UPI0030FE22FB
MALQKGLAEDGTSSSIASNNQGTTSAPSDVIEEGDIVATLQTGGGIIPQTTHTADLPVGSMTITVPETGKGTEAGPGGGTMMATAGVSRPGVLTPQAAGDGSMAGLRTQFLKRLMVGTKVQGMNGMSQSAWGGVSTVSGHNGISPGNPRQQGANLIDSGGHPTPLSSTGTGRTPY